MAIALISLTLLLIIGAVAMPRPKDKYEGLDLAGTFRRLFKNKRYIEGVVAQFFYVGAQIMCWTFIIHYGAEVFTTEPFNLSEKQAEITAFNLNIAAMVLFVTSRFICTYLLRVFRPGAMLAAFAAGGLVLTFGTIFIQGVVGLACLVGVSGCMSLMFPTIYGIALKGLGDDAKLGAAGLIMAILGGSVLPPVQGWITDFGSVNLGVLTLPAVNASFVLPAICFIVVGLYGLRTNWLHED